VCKGLRPLEIYWFSPHALTINNHCSIWTSIGIDSTSISKGIENIFMPLSKLPKSWNWRSNSHCNFTISLAYSTLVCHFHCLQVHFASAGKGQTHISITAFTKILALLQTLWFHSKDCKWVFPFLGKVAESVKCSSPTPSFKIFRHQLSHNVNEVWLSTIL